MSRCQEVTNGATNVFITGQHLVLCKDGAIRIFRYRYEILISLVCPMTDIIDIYLSLSLQNDHTAYFASLKYPQKPEWHHYHCHCHID